MLEAASESLTSQWPLALHTLEFPSKRPKHRTHSRSPMDSVAGNWHVRHARRSELKWVSLIWFIERVILFSDFLPFESYYALSLVWLREVESEGMQLLHPPFKNLRCTLTPNILLCEWSTNIHFYPSRLRRKPILVRVNLRSGKGEIKGVEQNQHCLEQWSLCCGLWLGTETRIMVRNVLLKVIDFLACSYWAWSSFQFFRISTCTITQFWTVVLAPNKYHLV